MKRPIVIVVAASTFLAGLVLGALQAASPVQPMSKLARVAATHRSTPVPSAPSVTSAGVATRSATGGGRSAQVSAAAAAPASGSSAAVPSAPAPRAHVHPCGPVADGFARCHAVLVMPDRKPGPSPSPSPTGLNPIDVQSAYGLPSTTAGAGQTVAIVDAFDDPNAESDLAVYRSRFNLPACTTANGCFRKVAADGSANFPRTNSNWAVEISLDLDMVSAACPNCHILLVEARDARITDLLAAVDEAATLRATEISNSYGGAEASGETGLDVHFNHPGVAITASSGDNGFGAQYPAASPLVTAVGGTTLTAAPGTARGWVETAWSGAGSGCSAFEAQPSWQAANANITSVCRARAIADVAADADPATGVSIYDTVPFNGASGWLIVGGTSVGAPLIASVFALAGGVSGTQAAPSLPYRSGAPLHDVIAGSNGTCGSLLCNAAVGWDGPTGLGTPAGAGPF